MTEFGNKDSGFSVEIEKKARMIRVRLWGFWEAELAETFTQRLLKTREAAPSPFVLLIDVSQFKPQREVGQEAFRTLIVSMNELKPQRTALFFENVLAKLQLARIIRESNAAGWSFYPSETAATAVLTKP